MSRLLKSIFGGLTKANTTVWDNSVVRDLKSLRHNGLKESLWQWWTISDPKVGRLVGKDEFGNRYYENTEEAFPRDRYWIPGQWNWDASQVPAGWHNWLSRQVDVPPNSPESKLTKPIYQAKFQENLTMGPGAYKCYSTVAPKVKPWNPNVAPKKEL